MIATAKISNDATNEDYPWFNGRVPVGYWDNPQNRLTYLRWLGNRCGFAKPTDWYQIRQKHFKQNYGGGLLANFYGFSLQSAVTELMPEYPWKPWLFGAVPQRFWQNPANRRAYMDWLGQRLGFTDPADWYGLTKRCFYKHRGAGLLANYYGDSPQHAIQEYQPAENRLPWLFRSVPQGYWKLRENRMRYLAWLAEQLDLIDRGGWITVRASDFHNHGGGGLLVYHYKGSIQAAVRDYLRDYEWGHKTNSETAEVTARS